MNLLDCTTRLSCKDFLKKYIIWKNGGDDQFFPTAAWEALKGRRRAPKKPLLAPPSKILSFILCRWASGRNMHAHEPQALWREFIGKVDLSFFT